MFNILNGHVNIDPNKCFKIKTGKITREHDFTLVKRHNNSFSPRTGNEWNKLLSADCWNSSSINMFNNIIYNYLVREGYS